MPDRHPRQQPARRGTSVYLVAATLLHLCLCWTRPQPAAADDPKRVFTHPDDLVAMAPEAFGRWLSANRPIPVPDDQRARILASLPPEGGVTKLEANDLPKLAALQRLLLETGNSLSVIVIDVPQAFIGLHARAVLLVSQVALRRLKSEELQGVAAHEIGHAYLWEQYARAAAVEDRHRIKELELMCDGIGMFTLSGTGRNASALLAGVEKISQFNRTRFGTALNESSYPTMTDRRVFARRVRAWLAPHVR